MPSVVEVSLTDTNLGGEWQGNGTGLLEVKGCLAQVRSQLSDFEWQNCKLSVAKIWNSNGQCHKQLEEGFKKNLEVC